MIEKDGIISIAWIDSQSGYSYMLSSTLDQNEVMKIAENISSNQRCKLIDNRLYKQKDGSENSLWFEEGQAW